MVPALWKSPRRQEDRKTLLSTSKDRTNHKLQGTARQHKRAMAAASFRISCIVQRPLGANAMHQETNCSLAEVSQPTSLLLNNWPVARPLCASQPCAELLGALDGSVPGSPGCTAREAPKTPSRKVDPRSAKLQPFPAIVLTEALSNLTLSKKATNFPNS